MSDYLEIDLKTIVKTIFVHWYWVLIPGLVLGLGAFIYSYTLPDVYEARAMFTLTEPPYAASFENQYRTMPLEKASEETLKELVLNSEITSMLYDLWDCPEEDKCTLSVFIKNILKVTVGSENMLVILSVQTKDRQNAAALANTWVALAMEAVEAQFYGFQPDQVVIFESQASQARLDMEQAGADLVEFAAANPIKVLQGELNDQLAKQAETNRAERALLRAQSELAALNDQLAFEDPEAILDTSYRLSWSLIQANMLNNPVLVENTTTDFIVGTTSPSQIVINLASQSETLTVSQFQNQLENWLTVVDARLDGLEADQDAVTTAVTTLQAEIQTLENKEIALIGAYERLQNVYGILATKYDEVRLTTADGSSGYVSLVTRANVPSPEDRLPHNTMRNTAIGIFVGGFLGLAGVVIADWWKSPDERWQGKI